jgi:hypothetical protein
MQYPVSAFTSQGFTDFQVWYQWLLLPSKIKIRRIAY